MTKVENKDIEKVEGKHGLRLFEDIDRLFDDYFTRGWLDPFRFKWPSYHEQAETFEGKTPHVDLVERDDDIVIKAELPGVEKKDLDISVTSNTVTIKGAISHEEKEEKGNYYRCEISRGSYSRTLALPREVVEAKAKATLKDGMLELILPKAEQAKKATIHTVIIE